MLNAKMWLLAIKIIFFLNTDLIFANYFINPSEVTWKDAQNSCNVTSVGDSVYAMTNHSELPENFMAWTSSRNRRSDWTSFYGCLDVAVDMVAIDVIKKKLNEYFPNSEDAIESKSVFKCAYFCTTKGDVFTFFRYVCKCAYKNELKSKLVEIPTCLFQDSTKNKNIDEVYSISRYSLPIFKFEKGLRTENIQKGGKETHKHQCLAKTNGTFTTNRCEALKVFTCDGEIIGYGTWTTAYYTCLVNHASISKNNSKVSDTWLGYFMYEEDKANALCVAIKKDLSRSFDFQIRPCLDRLPVLCHMVTPVFVNGVSQLPAIPTQSTFDREIKHILTNISDIERPDLCIKITAGGGVFFAVITIVLVIIICIQRRKLVKVSFTSLTARRDQNNYNEIPHQMAESITGQYYEVSPLSEIPAAGGKQTVQQNIDQIQHIDTTGYLIPSGMLETSGDYQTISD